MLSHWDLTGHVQQEAKGRKRDGGGEDVCGDREKHQHTNKERTQALRLIHGRSRLKTTKPSQSPDGLASLQISTP